MSAASQEDRLKNLLKNSMNSSASQKPKAKEVPQTHVEVQMGSYISPVANIKVVGVG